MRVPKKASSAERLGKAIKSSGKRQLSLLHTSVTPRQSRLVRIVDAVSNISVVFRVAGLAVAAPLARGGWLTDVAAVGG